MIDYFTNYFERWRSVMEPHLGTSFYLSAHSLGAYLIAHYAMKCPDRFKGLILVSPPGVSPRTHDKSYQDVMKSDMDYFPYLIEMVIHYVFASKFTAYDFGRFLGPRIGGMVLDRGIGMRCDKFDEGEKMMIGNYLQQCLFRRGTGERAIQVLFEITSKSLLQALIPLGTADKLASPDFKLPFSILFADNDLVSHFDNGFSEQLIRRRRSMEGDGANAQRKYHFKTVPNSTHKIMIDNPVGLAEIIIDIFCDKK